jgi:hypothetical protein
VAERVIDTNERVVNAYGDLMAALHVLRQTDGIKAMYDSMGQIADMMNTDRATLRYRYPKELVE